MKYINRARMGIELFFDQLSDLTVASSTDTPEDCVEILQQQPYTAQMEECRRIQGALRRLMSARYALKEMLPARVQMVATSQFTPTPDRLLPVFQWMQELQKANAQARIQWQYALQDVGYRLGESAGAFFTGIFRFGSAARFAAGAGRHADIGNSGQFMGPRRAAVYRGADPIGTGFLVWVSVLD